VPYIWTGPRGLASCSTAPGNDRNDQTTRTEPADAEPQPEDRAPMVG
jgi:hypothetical protein